MSVKGPGASAPPRVQKTEKPAEKKPVEKPAEKSNPALRSHAGESSFETGSRQRDPVMLKGSQDPEPASAPPASRLEHPAPGNPNLSAFRPGDKVEFKVESADRDVATKSGTLKVSESTTETDENGQSWNKYVIESEMKQGLSVSARGAESGGAEGQVVSYEARVPAGTKTLPNPYDPSTLPEGASITVRNQRIAQDTSISGELGVSLGYGFQHAEGTTTAVTRKDGNLRVMEGPTKMLNEELSAGFDVKGPLVLGASGHVGRKTGSETLSYYDFGNSPQEQAAYRSYLATGTPPADRNPGTITRSYGETELSLKANFGIDAGPIGATGSIGASVGGSAYDVTQTRSPDGKTQTEISWSERGGRVSGMVKVDPDGNAQRYVIARDLDPASAALANETLTGNKVKFNQSQDLVLTVDDAMAAGIVARAKQSDLSRDPYIADLRDAESNAKVAETIYRAAANGHLPELLGNLYREDPTKPLGGSLIQPSQGR